MPSIRGTVDYVLVSNSPNADPGSTIGKVAMSNRIDIDTGEPHEGNEQAEFFFWFQNAFTELETSEVLLRRSMWISMAEQALAARDRLDLVVNTGNDNAQQVGSLILVAKGAEYKRALS